MNLDKAIEILTDLVKPIHQDEEPDIPDAINLGIEALKHWAAHRQECPIAFRYLLPGETLKK